MTFREAVAAFRGHNVPHFDIVHRWRRWFLLSGALVLLSIIGLAVRGLNFSIDFEGGSLLKYPCPNCASGRLTADEVRSTLSRFGLSDAEVQVVNGDTLSVRTRSLTTLGSRAATILTLPNRSGVSSTDVVALLAQFGRSSADVSVTASRIQVKTRPLAAPVKGIVLTYQAETTPSADDIRSTLQGLGYPGAQVEVFGTTVVLRFTDLPVKPAAEASPTPSPSGSSSASPTPIPTVTVGAPSSRAEVVAQLAKQAGIEPSRVQERDLSEVSESDVISALADEAGASAGDVQTREITGKEQERLLEALAEQAGSNVTPAQINRQDVGPTWGAQISSKAIRGLIIFLILVTLYIAFRFEWKMALSAQTALIHDLVITAGIYALVGRTVTPATVIAILTILGYSLYDTVVIFDKVKENTESLAMVSRDTYSGVVNTSLNQVLMRSVNTSLVVLLPILSLLLFGGETLKDFAFALFVGVASGTYSSIFVASPVLALAKEREPKLRQIRERAAQRATRPQLRPVQAGDGGTAREAPAAAPAGSGEAPGDRTRPATARPKKRRKTTAAQRRRR